jgi:hypothetical protein
MNEEWGAKSRYYAAEYPAKPRALTRTEREISEKLNKIFPNIEQRVERAFKDANALIREALRTETAFKLSNDEKRQAVPVKVVEGIPLPLLKEITDNTDLLDLYLNLSLIKTAAKGMNKVKDNYEYLKVWKVMEGKLASQSEIDHVIIMLKHLHQELEKLKLFDKVWKIEEDVLGCYYLNQCRIELFWMPIGLIAASLSCTPESLTQVVAIHELAHAYTHLGYDIDDYAWETTHFARSSPEVVEGVAQFFTEAVCHRLENRYPETLKAYESLLEKQSGPYLAHQQWVGKDEAGGEAVRNSLVSFRRNGELNYDAFLEMIEQNKLILGRKRKKG